METRRGFLSKRIRLKLWQKLLLILGCTALAALAAWIYCEHIAKPVYTTTVRAQLRIMDTDLLTASGDPALTTLKLDIPGGLRDELAAVGSKNKGLFYRSITEEIQQNTGELIKPKDLKNMISVETDPEDESSRTVLIRVKNKDPEKAAQISAAAANQFGTLVFGAPAQPEQAEITDEAGDGGRTVTFRVTEAAASALPEKFLGKTLDLVNPVRKYLESDAFCEKIAQRAGIGAKGSEIRRNIGMTTTADPAVMTLSASWTDAEEARTLVRAEGEQIAAELFGGSFEEWQAAVDEPMTLSGDVKTWPNTGLITILAALIVLVVSYALFSQQPLFDTGVVIFFVIFTFICVFPFYYLFINTISDNNLVAGGQINFAPRGIHLKNYERILGQEELKNALIVTVSRTVLGTALMVLTSAWAGYLVTKRKMWHRSFWYRALVVTMYFNAGLIPWYTNMLMLGLTGNFLAYIIPGMVAPYNIILVKTYIEIGRASCRERV